MERLGKNLGSYFGETINVQELLCEIKTVAQKNGWESETFYSRPDFDLFALTRRMVQPKSSDGGEAAALLPGSRVYISTGIHGDEPAGPLAALRLLRDNVWPEQAEIVLLPCLNPVGFSQNRRENGQGIDLNRDYLNSQSPEIRAHVAWLEKQAAFDLCLCLHEDWESYGFYVYELNPDLKPSLADGMVANVAKVCPIDPSPIIEGREATGGIIRPNHDVRTRPLWPEAFWLLQHKTRLSYTLEAPSDFPLQVRVNALVEAVKTALA